MGSHRRKWGWWLVAAIAVAVAASLFLHRRPATSDPAASSEAEPAGTVVRDTVYVTVGDESVPVVRERKVDAGESRKETSTGTETPDTAEEPAATEELAAAAETVVAVPVKVLNGLLREKSGRDITLSTQAPDRIILTYAGKVDVPMLGEQGMNFSRPVSSGCSIMHYPSMMSGVYRSIRSESRSILTVIRSEVC